jgi:hypothetical protein
MRSRLVTTALALVAACGGTEPPTVQTPPPEGPNPTGLLAEPVTGRQIVTEARTVAPGRETTYCWYINLDNDEPIDVVRFNTAHEGGLHHFNVFASTLEREDGFDACPDSIELFVGARPIVDGSGRAVDYVFPGNVAFRLEPKTLLIFQLHYINTTTEPQETRYLLNLHTRPGVEPVLADIYGFTNLGIEIPARSQAELTTECRIDDEMMLLSMSAHFHARGTESRTELRRKNGSAEMLYRTVRWDDPDVVMFDPPVRVAVDDVIAFTCAYDNPTDDVIRYGPRASDEMCFTFGYYYPRRGLLPCL